MVAVENLEAALQARLGPGEHRKIVVVLDIVVAVEIAEEEIQPRREELGEFRRRRPPFAVVADAVVNMPPSSRNMSCRCSHMSAMPWIFAWVCQSSRGYFSARKRKSSGRPARRSRSREFRS